MIPTQGNKGRIISDIDENLLKSVLSFIKHNPDELLHIPYICTALAAGRIDNLKDGDIDIMEMDASEDLIDKAVEHNLNGLKGKSTLVRPLLLATTLRNISYIQARMKGMKVLTVGPRTESEIFMLTAAGFDPANIRGLDLMSYSPLIDVGDMHDMPYPDNSFDVVILGWVIAYSRNPIKAIREARRVAKADAVFAVGCEYSPLTHDQLKARGSILSDDVRHFEKLNDVLDLFEGDVGTVWFQDEIHPTMKQSAGSVVTVFQRKLPGDTEPVDP